jgi:hypothetical protein
MQKILFTEFAELRQGDGLGPKFYAGKAYWLTHDQAVRWKSEGVAEDAPADMAAENEQQPEPLRPHNVKIVRDGTRYNVVGPDDYHFNDHPLKAHDAEKLRQRVLAGEITLPAAEPIITPAGIEAPPPIPDLEPPAEAPQAPSTTTDDVDGTAEADERPT